MQNTNGEKNITGDGVPYTIIYDENNDKLNPKKMTEKDEDKNFLEKMFEECEIDVKFVDCTTSEEKTKPEKEDA